MIDKSYPLRYISKYSLFSMPSISDNYDRKSSYLIYFMYDAFMVSPNATDWNSLSDSYFLDKY